MLWNNSPNCTGPGRKPWPNRFLNARTSLKDEPVSPSKYSTVSTMCSSTRGPAIAPSLVTWPTRIITVPVCLAWRVNCAAHSRTCATEPGADVNASEYTVWIESITATSGLSSASCAKMASRRISGNTGMLASGKSSRRARIATWRADSSPLT